MTDYKSKVFEMEPTAKIDAFSRLKPAGREGYATFDDLFCVLINNANWGEDKKEQRAWQKAYRLLCRRNTLNKQFTPNPSPTLETPQNTGGNQGEGEGER